MSAKPMTKKEWMAYLDKAVKEFDWEAARESKDDPWSPVSIGVDVTKDGVHVVGIYALDKDTSQIFYAKHHPVPQRTWVGLTNDEVNDFAAGCHLGNSVQGAIYKAEAKLKELNA